MYHNDVFSEPAMCAPGSMAVGVQVSDLLSGEGITVVIVLCKSASIGRCRLTLWHHCD